MTSEVQRTAFLLRVDPDGVFAELECVDASTPGALFVPAAVDAALPQASVVYGVDPDLIAIAFQSLTNAAPGTQFRIAESKAPVHGINGSIEYKVNVTGRAVYTGSESDDAVDFKKATTIGSVAAGTLLAVLVQPVLGEAGVNIFGKTIQPRPGRAVILRCGANVQLNEVTGEYIASAEGRPVLDGSVISVLPVYEVGGDVDFSTGHIQFGGSVLVHGNVQDGFNITAKNIEINGTVGACEIVASGSIVLNGGVNGRNKALIKSGATITAKYINQARVEAAGHVRIRREVVNSAVFTRGRLMASSVMGGETLALKGVEVASLGSDLGVLTRVEPGIDYEYRKLEEKRQTVCSMIEAVIAPVAVLLGDRAKFKTQPPEKKAEVAAIYEQFKRLKAAFEKLTDQMRRFAATDAEPIKEVVVRKMLYHDCFVRTSICQRSFDKEHIGPLVLKEDIERGTIRLAPFSERTEVSIEEG